MKKKDIPNIITTSRMVLSPIIVPIIWSGQLTIGIILFIVAALTDAVDGYLSRKWDARTIEGKYMDVVADKEFALLTLLAAAGLTPALFICILLELAISTINIKSFKNKYPTKSVQVGRIKTGFLSVTTGLALFNPFLQNIQSLTSILIPILISATVVLQTLALNKYSKNYNDNKKKEEINEKPELNSTLSDQEVIGHMKNFTFYNKSFDKNKTIKKLYCDYLIPDKLNDKTFCNNNIDDLYTKDNIDTLNNDKTIKIKSKNIKR